MAECRNRDRKISAKKCAAGKRLQALPAVKAWSKAVKEQIGFKKGAFNKLPKRGTAAHNKLVKRQQEILKNEPRRTGRARKATNFFGF